MWKINAAPVYEVSEVGVIDSGTTSLALKDSSGEVFWSSTTTDQIHKMSADGLTNTPYAFSEATIASTAEDNGPALAAGGQPHGICYDKTYDIMYVACYADALIRAVDSSGIITTVAGTLGSVGDVGLGGPASEALVSTPSNCAVDTTGNLYVVLNEHNAVRMIDRATKFWNPFLGTYGVFDYAGDGGQVTSALMSAATNLWDDTTQFIYIALDKYHQHHIRRVDLFTGIINTFAGGGVKDHFDSIFSGAGGPATSASLPNLLVIAGDNSNNIMICADGQVMYIDGTTNVIDLVGGRMIDGGRANTDDDVAFQSSGDSVPAYDATFGYVSSIVSDGSQFYLSDMTGLVIRKLSLSSGATYPPSARPSKAPITHKTHKPSNSWERTKKPTKAPKTNKPSKAPNTSNKTHKPTVRI